MLIIETILLLIVLGLSLFLPSICNAVTTIRGLTAYIFSVSVVALPLFYGINIVLLKLVNMLRKYNNLEEIDMEPIKACEMSFASTGNLIGFYEDFYAVTIVSYIYY